MSVFEFLINRLSRLIKVDNYHVEAKLHNVSESFFKFVNPVTNRSYRFQMQSLVGSS